MNYFIKDLGIGHGVFVKMNEDVVDHSNIHFLFVGAEGQHDSQCWGGAHRGQHLEGAVRRLNVQF